MEAPEVYRLVLMLIFAPAFYIACRRIRGVRGLGLLQAAFYTLCVSWVATVIESFAIPAFFGMVQHLAYGVAGALALAGAVRMTRTSAADRAAS
ncbi:MAG: hypothetical protein Q7W30_02925 [Coriobacteriia bacterium]|nr:hypothetical protein [Coriobacteriia bacterium]